MRWLPVLALVGCIEPLTLDEQPHSRELGVGESTEIELWSLRFDVDGYEQSIDLPTLRALPRATLDEIWLLDMPLEGLVENSLAQLADLPIDNALDMGKHLNQYLTASGWFTKGAKKFLEGQGKG